MARYPMSRPIVDAVPVDGLDQRVRLGLRGADVRAQADRAQNAPAAGDDAARFEARARVKDLARQRGGTLEAFDRVSLAHRIRDSPPRP